jgi:hypothetical protein
MHTPQERRRCLDRRVLSLYHRACLTSPYCSCKRIRIRSAWVVLEPLLQCRAFPIRVPYLLSALLGHVADPNLPSRSPKATSI